MLQAAAVARQTLLLIVVTLFAASPLIVRAFHPPKHTPAAEQLIFFGLAALPGLVGLVNYVSSQRMRYERQRDELHRLAAAAAENDSNVTDPSKFEPSLVSWLTGALLLTGVFLIVAVVEQTGDVEAKGVEGIVYAGYGAYVATLYFLVGRLNAHALSPRFLVNSAIKSAIAILIGLIASSGSAFFTPNADGNITTKMMLFMIGFFHDWALGFIRKKAVELFQANQNAATELPLGMVEGVDDSAADLLDEMGVSSVQHLAMQDPLELSMRSLYPIKRVIDWVDQAILTLNFRDKIGGARELGMRGISDFVAVYDKAAAAGAKSQAGEVMTALAQKLGMSEAALYLMADGCRHDENVRFLLSLRRVADGKEPVVEPSPDAKVQTVPDALAGPTRVTISDS